jgi:hypothetical protein
VTGPGDSASGELLQALGRLDALLERAVAVAEASYGAHGDPFRGLHIDLAEVEQLLGRRPAEPVLGTGGGADAAAEPFLRLKDEFGLSEFDLDVVLVALAPELDLRYERLYAYLQDDVTRKRPTVDLALHLLCSSAAESLGRRAAFQPDAPLVRKRVIQLVPDPSQAEAPLLRQAIKVDEQIVRLLLGTGGLDTRLETFCELQSPGKTGESLLPEAIATELARMAAADPLRLYFHGAAGSGRRAAAETIAARRGVPLLVADLARMPAGAAPVLAREGRINGALLYAANVDSLRERDAGELEALLSELGRSDGSFVLAGSRPWRRRAPSSAESPVGLLTVEFAPPPQKDRRRIWQDEIKRSGLRARQRAVDDLAGLFTLTQGQIRDAVAEAASSLRGTRGTGVREALFAAARAQGGDELATLAVKLRPSFGWDDIVLPEDSVLQLRELCQRVVHRGGVLADWGFGQRLSLGRGVSALFSGPPGTGKTMAAEIIAVELGLDLYRIDLAGVISKWIGETEKNLDRIFRAAENANVVMLIDEAEALFGKRTEVRDSHDRYANVEISYLLQKMEEYEGVAILATNRITDLDEAFTRRISHVIRFPLPEAAERARIWESVWPAETPRSDRLDLGLLARDLSFSGAEIKNVALAAAFLAAEAGTPVTMEHLLHAAKREYEKTGKSFPETRVTELLEAVA